MGINPRTLRIGWRAKFRIRAGLVCSMERAFGATREAGTYMALITWDSIYSVGIDSIDRLHGACQPWADRAVHGSALENDRFLDSDQCFVTRQRGK